MPCQYGAHRLDHVILRHGALRFGLFLQVFVAAFFQLRELGAEDQSLIVTSPLAFSSGPG